MCTRPPRRSSSWLRDILSNLSPIATAGGPKARDLCLVAHPPTKERERCIENIDDEVAPHMYHESWDYLVRYFPALEAVRHQENNNG